MVLDLGASLLSQPVLEAARRRGLRPCSSTHDDVASYQLDDVPLGIRRLDAHPRRLSTKENLASPIMRGLSHAAKSLDALELIDDPLFVTFEEGPCVLTVACGRQHYLNAVGTYSDAQPPCGR